MNSRLDFLWDLNSGRYINCLDRSSLTRSELRLSRDRRVFIGICFLFLFSFVCSAKTLSTTWHAPSLNRPSSPSSCLSSPNPPTLKPRSPTPDHPSITHYPFVAQRWPFCLSFFFPQQLMLGLSCLVIVGIPTGLLVCWLHPFPFIFLQWPPDGALPRVFRPAHPPPFWASNGHGRVRQ